MAIIMVTCKRKSFPIDVAKGEKGEIIFSDMLHDHKPLFFVMPGKECGKIIAKQFEKRNWFVDPIIARVLAMVCAKLGG